MGWMSSEALICSNALASTGGLRSRLTLKQSSPRPGCGMLTLQPETKLGHFRSRSSHALSTRSRLSLAMRLETTSAGSGVWNSREVAQLSIFPRRRWVSSEGGTPVRSCASPGPRRLDASRRPDRRRGLLCLSLGAASRSVRHHLVESLAHVHRDADVAGPGCDGS